MIVERGCHLIIVCLPAFMLHKQAIAPYLPVYKGSQSPSFQKDSNFHLSSSLSACLHLYNYQNAPWSLPMVIGHRFCPEQVSLTSEKTVIL